MGQNISFLRRSAQLTYRFLTIWLISAILTMAPSVGAAEHISKVNVEALVGNNPTILDWKTNELIIPFDLPETVWVDNVELLVSASPTGQLRHRRNLQLRINGSDPIILKAQGQRFDARVRLEQKHLRRRGNKLYLSGITTSSTCAGPNSAGWEISKDRSLLVFYGRNMTRDLNLRDLDSVWRQQSNANLMNVGLKVMGEEAFRHESLITQGVTLRAGAVPKLKNTFSGNDIDIIAGLRSDVLPYIRSEKGRLSQGAQIILDEKRPPRLILTGDTTEQLRESVNAFSQHKLPLTRRMMTTANEVNLQPILSNSRAEFKTANKLSDAGVLAPVNSWLTPPQSFNFDTPFAAQRTGRVTLRLNSNDVIAKDSTVNVTLNGRKLGQTQIDKSRKTVRFDIPEGYLVGSNNEIQIQPDLRPSPQIDICSVAQTRPGLSFGLGSKITLSKPVNKNINDLSNFAARSGPFATSDDVVIYGTSRNQTDKRAALRLIGRLAHISGRAWTQVQYIEGTRALIPPTDNLLIIGPKIDAMNKILEGAPKALRLALNGQKIPEIEDQQIASILKVAALNERQAFELAASSARRDAKRYTSGLIALYDDMKSRRTIGVITTRPGASFNTAANNLLNPTIWNMLKGSVAQWDDNAALMVQTGQPRSLPAKKSANNLGGLGVFNWDGFSQLNMDWANSLSDIWSAPPIDIEDKTVSVWASMRAQWASLFEASPDARIDDANMSDANISIVPVPRIKPVIKPAIKPLIPAAQTSETPKSIGLRGSFNSKNFTTNGLFKPSSTIDFTGLKSSVSSSVKAAKTMSANAYNNFESWGNKVNNARVANGSSAFVPSPILALLCLVFIGLILLSLASPHQRRY